MPCDHSANIRKKAISACQDDENLLIARASYDGEIYIGSASKMNKYCSIVVNGKEVKVGKFDVLVKEAGNGNYSTNLRERKRNFARQIKINFHH